MTDRVARLRSVFIAPPHGGAPAPRHAPARRLLVSSVPVGVVGAPRVAAPLAAALALALAREAGAGCALVAGPGVAPGSRVGAWRAAARAATALEARELSAVASGRLVLLSLDAPARTSDFARAAAAVDGPAVLLVAGPRAPEADALLATQEAIVLALGPGTDPVLAELARESLAALGPPVLPTHPRPGPIAARLALAGLAAPPSLRRALRPALELAR